MPRAAAPGRANFLIGRAFAPIDDVRYALFGAALVIACLTACMTLAPVRTLTFTPDMIGDAVSARTGYAYQAVLPPFPNPIYDPWGDGPRAPARSSMTVSEDGQPLGPAHTHHDVIASDGMGAFSHYGPAVVFSSSDGTDPRSNGRTYVMSGRAVLDAKVVYAALAALGLLGVRILADTRMRQILRPLATPASFVLAIAMAALAAQAVFGVTGFYPYLAPDSGGYISQPMQRGYFIWAVLHVFQALALDLRAVMAALFLLLCVSGLTLGYAVGRATRNPALGWLTAALLFANTNILQQYTYLLSEPFFLPFMIFHLAFAIEAIRSGRMRDLVLAAIFAGAAMLVRPAGYALAAGLVLTIAIRPWRLHEAAIGAGALALVLAAGCAPNLIRNGVFATHAFGGFALLGHVVHFADEDADYKDPELAAAVLEATNGVSTAHSARWPRAYMDITTEEYNTLLWANAVPAARRVLDERLRREGRYTSQKLQKAEEAGLSDMAVAIVRDHPVLYARHVLTHIYGLWSKTVPALPPLAWRMEGALEQTQMSLTVQAARAFAGSAYPPDSAAALWTSGAGAHAFPVDSIWINMLRVMQPARWAAAVASPVILLAVGWMMLRRRRIAVILAAAAFCSVQIWAYMTLVAMSQPALIRYAVVADVMLTPLLVLGSAGLAYWLAPRTARVWRSVRGRPQGAPA